MHDHHHIVVANDDKETCALLKQALSVDGFVVTVADSRTALMRFLNDFAVDLITATSV